jgi:DNA-binding transcriptional LysR family regulator
MELRHLRYFVTVAEELHFGQAAKRLRMTQPPLSQQIQQLEDELGVDLFRRQGRNIVLTDAGRVFLDGANKTLEQAEIAVQNARRTARGEIGKLDVGLVVTAAYSVVPTIITAYREQYPNVRVVLHEMTSPEQLQALRKHTIDIGFMRLPVFGDDLEIKIILREPLIVALPEYHPLAAIDHISVKMLADEQFILSPPRLRLAWYDQVTCLCQEAGFFPEISQQAVHVDTILSLVAMGMGITLLPASVGELRRKGVAYRPLADADILIDMAVVWRKGEFNNVLRAFQEIVSEIYQSEKIWTAQLNTMN